jgi:hypothetical protein
MKCTQCIDAAIGAVARLERKFLLFGVNGLRMIRTNRFFQRTATASLLAVFAIMAAQPAYAGTTPGGGEITIVRPLSFVIDDNLDFGTIVRGTTAGTVTITPTGTRTQTGGVTLINGGGHKAASFAGQGTFLQRVEISLGANSISLNGPGAPMRVRDFVIGSTPTAVLTSTPLSFRIAGLNGVFSFPIGATLDVAANQAPGVYSGNWSITLNYF